MPTGHYRPVSATGDGVNGDVPPPAATRPSIDIGRALDLLAQAVGQAGENSVCPQVWSPGAECSRGPHGSRGGPECLVGRALSLAQVGGDDHQALCEHGVRELYANGRLPVQLTLGALAVLDAARRSQHRGYAWGDALGYAISVAVRFVDLLPVSAIDAAAADLGLVFRPSRSKEDGTSCRG